MKDYFIRVLSGIIIFPLTIIGMYAWKRWEKAGLLGRILSAPLLFPLIGFLKIAAPWWNDLK